MNFISPLPAFQSRGFLPHPLNELFAFGGGEPGIGVNQSVFDRWHFLVLQLLTHVFEPGCCAVRVINRPVGKIQMPSPLLHIACHQPRHRRDMAIPRPFRLVRMTIVTRCAQRRRDFWRRHVRGQKVANDRRVRARRIYELHQGEYHNARDENPFQHLFHSMRVEASNRKSPCRKQTPIQPSNGLRTPSPAFLAAPKPPAKADAVFPAGPGRPDFSSNINIDKTINRFTVKPKQQC